jgi:hypothetical protein
MFWDRRVIPYQQGICRRVHSEVQKNIDGVTQWTEGHFEKSANPHFENNH